MTISTTSSRPPMPAPRNEAPPQPEVSWSAQLDEWVAGAPLADQENLYVTDIQGRLSAVDLDTGEKKWSCPGTSSYNQTQVLENGPLLRQVDQELRAVDRQTGETLWTHFTGDKVGRPLFGEHGELFLTHNKPEGGQMLLRVNPENGRTLWSREVDFGVQMAGGKILTGTGEGRVKCLDAESGALCWAFRDGSVRVDEHRDGRILYTSTKYLDEGGMIQTVAQRDCETGELLWTREVEEGLAMAPQSTPDGSKVVFIRRVPGTYHTEMEAVQVESGETAWRIATESSARVVYDAEGDLYLSHAKYSPDFNEVNYYAHRLDAETGRELWTADTGSNNWTQVVGDSVISVEDSEDGSYGGVIKARHADTGEIRWEVETEKGISGLVVGPELRIHLLDGNCTLKVLDSQSGETLSQYHNGETLSLLPRASHDGRLYLADHDGQVMALKTCGDGPIEENAGSGYLRTPQSYTYQAPLREGPQGLYCDSDRSGDYAAGTDPVLLRDPEGALVGGGLSELAASDENGDGRLTGQELNGLFLWRDYDGDGAISDNDMVHPVGPSDQFDKARIDIADSKIVMARGSRCDH